MTLKIDPTRAKKINLTQKYLKNILKYDPDTGVWVWIINGNNQFVKVDRVAGCYQKTAGWVIKINTRLYKSHRLAWLYMTGEDPDTKDIDHIDGDRWNNKWNNLRLADDSENQGNQKLAKNNTSGYKGVSKANKKWYARVYRHGVQYFLGFFNTPEDAALAYNKKALELFGEFARINVVLPL